MNRSAVPPPVTQVMDAQSWLPALMARVEARLTALVEGHGQTLADDARATLEAGGKRLRPMLVLLCAGPGAADAVRAAAAIELVHMAIVHDDVLDAAPLRRGLPRSLRPRGATGRWRSATFCSRGRSPSSASRTRAVPSAGEAPARASVGLALGELAQRRDAFDLDLGGRYRERCLLKTARLFECACLIGRAGATRIPPSRRSPSSAARSGSRSSSWTTSLTSPDHLSGRARPGHRPP